MGQYSYTQPSSSEPSLSSIPSLSSFPSGSPPSGSGFHDVSSVRRRGRRSGQFGIPSRCGCGLAVVTHTSTTELNPGRIFYGCKNYKNGGHHLFKWWDEAIAEEIQDMRSFMDNQGDHIRSINTGESVLESLKNVVDVSRVEREVLLLKEELRERRVAGFESKNLIVILGVVFLLVMILFRIF